MMMYTQVCLDTFGYELPPRVLTSEEIENRLAPLYDRLKLPAGRLELMSGIRERRLWPAGTRPSARETPGARLAYHGFVIRIPGATVRGPRTPEEEAVHAAEDPCPRRASRRGGRCCARHGAVVR